MAATSAADVQSQDMWANPHSSIFVEQKTEDGKPVRWALDGSAPIGALESRGFNKDSFKPGEVIEACGFAPKSAFRSRTGTWKQDKASPRPVWLVGVARVITARLLLTQMVPRCIGRAMDPWNYASVRKS